MNKNKTFLLSIFFYSIFYICNVSLAKTINTYESIAYQITPNLNERMLSVHAKYYGNFKNLEVIDLPYKWGNASYIEHIKNIQILNPEAKISINKKYNNELAIRLPCQTNFIEISYEIHFLKNDSNFDIQYLIFTQNLIHIPGHALFAVPNNLALNNNLEISVLWHNIPGEWRVESSHGSGKSQSFNSNSFDLLHSVFIIGKFRKYEFLIKNKPIRLCLYGSFDFSDKTIIRDTKKIIQSQRDFFNDYSSDNYLVVVLEPINKNAKMALMGGVGLYNSITTYFSHGITEKQFKLLFAHEHMHNWIGGTIQNSEEELNYWWSEGFTDYYSRVLSAKCGALSVNEFITEIYNILYEYYNSPVINVKNTMIKNKFWNSYDVYRQVYLRGFVFALFLNCKIKNNTKNSSTDEILRYFYSNNENIKFSNRNFLKVLQNINIYTKEIEKDFNDAIIKGRTISLAGCMLCLPLDKTKDFQQNDFYYRIKQKLTEEEEKQLFDFFNL